MLTSLRLINYRSHGDTLTQLFPVTLLVGPAGGGKSNLFKGLATLQGTVIRSLPELFPPGTYDFQWTRSRWAADTDPISFEVGLEGLEGFEGERARYVLRLAEAPRPLGVYVLGEFLARSQDGQSWEWVFRRDERRLSVGEFGDFEANDPTVLNRIHSKAKCADERESFRFTRTVARALASTSYFHLQASVLRSPGDSEDRNRIGYYGENLPSFLGWCKTHSEGHATFERIQQEMTELLPHLASMLLIPSPADRQVLAFLFKGFRGYIDAADLSDGTLYTLGLLAAIQSPARKQLLCLEEPETGLHPRRLRWLFDKCLEVAYPDQGVPATQVLVSTHSPYIVNLFRDMSEAVQVVEQKDGRTSVTSLPEVFKKLHITSPPEGMGHEWAMGLFEGL